MDSESIPSLKLSYSDARLSDDTRRVENAQLLDCVARDVNRFVQWVGARLEGLNRRNTLLAYLRDSCACISLCTCIRLPCAFLVCTNFVHLAVSETSSGSQS
jgi:hypothetical protein